MGRNGPVSISCRLLWCGLGVLLLLALQGVLCEHEPTESECRPYIERALKEHHVDETLENDASSIEQEENSPIDEISESNEQTSDENKTAEEADSTTEDSAEGGDETDGEAAGTDEGVEGEQENKTEENEIDNGDRNESVENLNPEENASGEDQTEDGDASNESTATQTSDGDDLSQERTESTEEVQKEADVEDSTSQEDNTAEEEGIQTENDSQEGGTNEQDSQTAESSETTDDANSADPDASEDEATGESQEASNEKQSPETTEEPTEQASDTTESTESRSEQQATGSVENDKDTQETTEEVSQETETATSQETAEEGLSQETAEESPSEEASVDGPTKDDDADGASPEEGSETTEEGASKEATEELSTETTETTDSVEPAEASAEGDKGESETTEEVASDESQQEPVEELTREAIIPANLRPRDHITQILKLDEDSVAKESALAKTVDTTLHTLKKLYDNAIKPLEILYKYRDLSNRHFGDPEIFSKPLILFMGPWSGGKSSTINYLLDLEFTELSLRTGAEPSPAYFNILTYGEETEILDGTQLAADWTFSGLQKFGQGLLDRLRGVKLKNRLLEKVNIVEIPGILEIRKQVQRLFPFNDACQWFIDRADIIFLVYDPAKLDVGPETEAILDQLKGREYQTRIILNKADQVKPEELMRVQGTLIWNISPLMSSQEPPVMYTTSLWSLPYETNAPTRLLIAQERAFLRDLREAIDKRVENKIASARRFAVRVRNHAKMVDCYLTTYYNHKTFFGNKKKIADDISENPQKYHIYEGLSTLTNISRYDLPDPEMYRDFFRINNLYDFTKLSDTCTYFRGCPINKLDIAIAYDLPELVGKYKKSVEQAKTNS